MWYQEVWTWWQTLRQNRIGLNVVRLIIIKDQLQCKSHKNIRNIQIHKNMKKSQPVSTKASSKKLTTTQQPQPQKQPQVQPQPKPSTTKHQNMKQFKEQIDHEIAKCLDTLDRQGLKYLKETLRSSNMFNEEIKEAINAEKSREKRKVSKSPTKNKKHDQIQQEIIEEYETFMEDNEEPSNQKTKLGPNLAHPLKQQKIMPLKLEKFQDKIQQPLKPFAIRSGSRQASRPVIEETKVVDKRIVQKEVHESHEQQLLDKKQIDKIVQKISHLPEEKLKKVGRFIQILQKSQKIQEQQLLNLKQTRPYLFKAEDIQAEISNPSNMMKSSALSKSKKAQKATSLYNPIMKGSKKNSPIPQKQLNQPHYSEHGDQTFQNDNQINEQIPEVEEENKPNHPKSMEIPDHLIKPSEQYIHQQQKLQQKKVQEKHNDSATKRNDSGLIKKGSFVKNFPISNIKKPLDIEVTESHQADTLQINQVLNQSKMVRLGKKKLGTNKVKIVLLRNRGHPSIIGLTGIQFYNTNGKLIPIMLQNIKSQSPKLLKLFNGIHETVNQQQMFTTVFKRDYQIDLQIPQKIGGMKIWNYNKSQIQSSKQTDWIQLYINDRLSWEGYVQKGSYNEITDYCTLAVIEQGFDFSLIKKQSGSQKRIEELSETPSSNQNIKMEGVSASTLSLGKKGERDNKKVDWLQKTIMQENIKKIIQEDKKQEIQTKKTIFKPTRFSQIYLEEQKPGKLAESNQKFYGSSNKKNQQSLSKHNHNEPVKQINPQKTAMNLTIQRTNRSSSQKIEEQKDIFSMFGQSLIKQKMKANEINSKVNQMNEKIEKLKETYRKEPELGYSSLIMKEEPAIEHKSIPKIQIKDAKEKKSYEKQSLDDFMNDSLFQEPVPRNEKKIKQVQPFSVQKVENQATRQKSFNKKPQIQQKQKNQKVDIDDFLNQLNDLVGTKENKYRFGNQKQKSLVIPQLPKGNKLQIILLSNWGDQQSIGLNKIQFFDHQGSRVFPTQAKSSSNSSITTIFSQNKGYITELSSQWKSTKKQQIKFLLTFSKKIQLSLIRIWNYIGDRVHAMIGVRKIQVVFDGSLIFVGDIRKNGGTSRDQIFKSGQNILFTNNVQIQKRIIENDWLTQQLINQRQETVIFKKTIQNFMRPQTNCTGQKQLKMVQNKQGFKLPKRNCFQYDPPSLPSGHYLKLILHTTWGDRDFIGLNSIIVYDEKGQQITDIKKISQFPAPLITLTGYQKDKRILTNLFDGKNLTSNDESIWLAPYLQDIDKMEKQAQNAILIQFDKCCTLSAINIYNYVKTPKRGVREIEIHVDNYLIYRGYLRMANIETGQILTTINFTKEASLLEKIGYVGYNQDNLGQEVLFYNQGKTQKSIF